MNSEIPSILNSLISIDDKPIIKSKNKDELFMRMVYENADFSKDPRTKIGAILTLDSNFVSSGFNGFPRKVKDYRERYENREIKYKFICHGEANAISTAARLGRSTLDTTLYTQGIPCEECTKTLIQAGVKEVVIHKQWPNLVHSKKWVESIEISEIMMEESGLRVRSFDQPLGVEGFLDGRIITV